MKVQKGTGQPDDLQSASIERPNRLYPDLTEMAEYGKATQRSCLSVENNTDVPSVNVTRNALNKVSESCSNKTTMGNINVHLNIDISHNGDAKNSISVAPHILVHGNDVRGISSESRVLDSQSNIPTATKTMATPVSQISDNTESSGRKIPSEQHSNLNYSRRRLRRYALNQAADDNERVQPSAPPLELLDVGRSLPRYPFECAVAKEMCSTDIPEVDYWEHECKVMTEWVSWRTKANAQLASLILLRNGNGDIGTWERIRKPISNNISDNIIRHGKEHEQTSTSLPGKPYIMYGIPRVQVCKGPF